MRELEDLPTEELLELALEIAGNDPSGDSDERWEPIRQLHLRPENAVFDAASEWCGAAESWKRALGADLLGQLGSENGEFPFAEVSEPILMALLEDGEESVVSSALLSLGHLEVGDLDRICRLAVSESADIRYAVAYCLGPREDGGPAEATLLTLSADQDTDVRNWATFGLGTLSEADSEEIRQALLARLRDEDPEVRGEAMIGLAQRGDARVTPAILQEFERDEVGALVVAAAAKQPDAAFVPHLATLAEAYPEDPDIQEALGRCRELA